MGRRSPPRQIPADPRFAMGLVVRANSTRPKVRANASGDRFGGKTELPLGQKPRAGHGALGGELRSNAAPEATSEHDDAARVDVLAPRNRIVDRQRIGGELGLAGLALAGAVTAIVHADDRPLTWPVPVGKRPRNL